MPHQQQRRKGNVQKASSAQAAKLVSSSGAPLHFIGFDQFLVLDSQSSKQVNICYDGIDTDARNAFKKLGKKDEQTREKGLKELLCLLEKMEYEEVKKCFHLYASNFPKLSMDGKHNIRQNSLHVLENFILALKKDSEQYILNILPYVLLASVDNHSQVAHNANSLLKNCFRDEKLEKAVRICAESTSNIMIEILNDSHYLIEKDENEEITERIPRLKAQAFRCLQRICYCLTGTDQKNRILQLFDDHHLKSFQKSAVQILSALFHLGYELLVLKWYSVLDTGVPKMALAILDHSDRSVCCSSANFLSLVLELDSAPDILDICTMVIPKFISLVRKKESHWFYVMPDVMQMIVMLGKHLPFDDRAVFLLQILDAFFDGSPWNPALKTIWVESFMKVFMMLMMLFDDHDMDYSHSQHILNNVLKMIDVVANWNEPELSTYAAEIPIALFGKSGKFSEDIYEQFRKDLFANLINSLPASEGIIRHLLCKPYGLQNDLQKFRESILTNSNSSPALIACIVESCNRDILVGINLRMSICKFIVGRFDLKSNENMAKLVKALVVASRILGEKLTDHLELDDSHLCMYIIEAVASTEDWCSLEKLANNWLAVVDLAVDWITENFDLKQFHTLIDFITHLSDHHKIFSSIIDRERMIPFNMAIELGKFILCNNEKEFERAISEKLTQIIFDHLLLSDFSDEVIAETVQTVLSSGIDADFFFKKMWEKLSCHEMSYESILYICLIASKFPMQYVTRFLSVYCHLDHLLMQINCKYIVQLLKENEFLSATLVTNLLVICNTSDLNIQAEVYKALFLLNLYVDTQSALADGTKVYASLFYAIAVYSIQFLEPFSLFDQISVLNDSIKSLILYDEKMRFSLLYSVLSQTYLISPAFLLCIRHLSVGMDLKKFMRDLQSSNMFEDKPYAIESVAAAIRYQAYDSINQMKADACYWVCSFEMESSLQDTVSSLRLLSSFINDAQSFFDTFIFTFRNNADQKMLLNCSLLRFLRFCCHEIEQMDVSMRDMIFCGLIASLESCVEHSKHCSSNIFALYSTLAVELFIEFTSVVSLLPDVFISKKEWEDLFRQSAEGMIFKWFLELPYNHQHPSLSNALARSIYYCSENAFVVTELSSITDAELDAMQYPERLQSLLIPTLFLLDSNSVYVQFAALKVLKSVLPEVFRLENKQLTQHGVPIDEDIGETVESNKDYALPSTLSRIIERTDDNSGCYIPRALLVWDAIISCLTVMDMADRIVYFNCVSQLLSVIMPRLFGLCPLDPDVENMVNDEKFYKCQDLDRTSTSQYYFSLFYRTTEILPAAVRQWYTSLPRSAAVPFRNYTVKYISALIWKMERRLVRTQQLPSVLKIQVLGGARQIHAEYELDDVKMRLKIEFPSDYPLSVPRIDCENVIDRRDTKRKWLMQLTIFLSHQNGTIAEALKMWLINIEKRLAGVEDCMICMVTIHAATYELPRVRCKQCKKRFHYSCIHKWFDTSGRTSCPLCRADFITKPFNKVYET